MTKPMYSFLNFKKFILYMCASLGVHTGVERKGLLLSETPSESGTTGSCELPQVDAEKQTPVFREQSSKSLSRLSLQTSIFHSSFHALSSLPSPSFVL